MGPPDHHKHPRIPVLHPTATSQKAGIPTAIRQASRRLSGALRRRLTATSNEPEVGQEERGQSDSDTIAEDDVTLIEKDTDTNEFEEQYGKKGPRLGYGSWGTVHLHRIEDTTSPARLCAVKTFRKQSNDSQDSYEERVRHEFRLAERLRGHPNVIDVLGLRRADNEPDILLITSAYCAGGTLFDLIASLSAPLPAAEVDCFFKQLMRGIEHMHAAGIAHGDLKPRNLLLTGAGTLKICDFGCSRE